MSFVIPGRDEVANPESSYFLLTSLLDSGFAAYAAPRNDW